MVRYYSAWLDYSMDEIKLENASRMLPFVSCFHCIHLVFYFCYLHHLLYQMNSIFPLSELHRESSSPQKAILFMVGMDDSSLICVYSMHEINPVIQLTTVFSRLLVSRLIVHQIL